MPWYRYKRGGWEIAVDAMNQRDAAQHIKIHAPGAVFQGEFTPPSMAHPSMATAMVTTRRQEQISETIRRENEEWEMGGSRPAGRLVGEARMTTEEWVHKINQLAAEIEDYMASTAPSSWATDEQLEAMNEKYRRLAKRGPDEEGK